MSNGTSGRLDRVLAAATLAGRPSGSVLRLERLALRIDQSALARQMGMSRQRLDVLERREKLTPDMVERYRAALRMIVSIIGPLGAEVGDEAYLSTEWCSCGREPIIAKGLGTRCYQAAYRARPEIKAKKAAYFTEMARLARLAREAGLG